MSPRRALVTGIAGQDGSYLAELLLEQGHHVIGLVRPPADRPFQNIAAIRDDVEIVAADLLDRDALREAIAAAAPDDVFHLAAPTFVPRSWEDPSGTLGAIAEATAVVLQAAGEAGARVLGASSPEIFGDAGESPQHEETRRRPRSPYGVAKLAAHELVRVVREADGLHACSVIPYNHESPRRPERFVTRTITRGAAAIRLGLEDELVLGDLGAVRDWSHAADVVRGMAMALAHDEPGDYVLGSGVGRTVGDFVDAAFAAVELEPEGHIRVDPSLVRPPEPVPLVADATRAREVLGWEPRIAFDALVAEMVEADLGRLRSR